MNRLTTADSRGRLSSACERPRSASRCPGTGPRPRGSVRRGTPRLGDIDGDDQDLLVGNFDDHPTLLRNDSRNGHWLLVRLVGAGSGFLASNDPREHFGLGPATKADALEVTWPDGRVERFTDLAADRLYTIEDGGGTQAARLLGHERRSVAGQDRVRENA